MCTKRELADILKKMVTIYKNYYGDSVVSIYLYGSYARGDFDSGSDLDIAAIVRGEREELQKKLDIIDSEAADIGYDYDIIVSPVVIPEEEFVRYKDSLPYYRNIAREGVSISA